MRPEHILKQEIVRRAEAEEALRQLQAEFETRLIDLTSELSQANEALREQIIHHQEIEYDLRETIAGLQAELDEVPARLHRSEESLQTEDSLPLAAGESLHKKRAEFEERTRELKSKILDLQTNLELVISQRE